ncbi:hypothetical protein [Magnetospirillum sp. 15-1]|uniref:hypothetical protein n=1 Tax=Magnetospirillum sp. 15-1 TaxID=1979370 RepID=UPI0011420822|nr:hypothetical protein [Magnetospirillum sp. 15-1]
MNVSPSTLPYRRFALSLLALAVLGLALIGLQVSIATWPVRIALEADVDMPRAAQRMNAYYNFDYSHPVTRPLSMGGGSATLTFEGVPKQLRYLRLDLGTQAGVTVTVKQLRFVALSSWLPEGRRVIKTVSAAEFSKWRANDLMVQNPGLFLVTGRDPHLWIVHDFELSAGLPDSGPPTVQTILFWLLVPATAAAALIALSALVPLLRQGRRSAGNVALMGVAASCAAATFLTSFPGHWNFDEYFSLSELYRHALSDIQPPLHSVAWHALIRLTAALGAPPIWQLASMLVVQTLITWAALGYIALQFRSRLLGAAMLVTLTVLPSTAAYMGHIGKDTQHAVALIVGLALILAARKHRSRAALGAALAALWYSWAIRSNAPPSVMPLLFAWGAVAVSWRFPEAPRRKALGMSAALAAGLSVVLLAVTSLFNSAAIDRQCCAGHAGYLTPLHDLMGMSHQLKTMLVPEYLVSDPPYTLDDIERYYLPSNNLNLAKMKTIAPPLQGPLMHDWLTAIATYPGTWIEHRVVVLLQFLGLSNEPNPLAVFLGSYFPPAGREIPSGPAFATLMQGLDDVPPALDALRAKVINTLISLRNTVFFRPWLFAALSLALLPLLRLPTRNRLFSGTLMAGSALYFAPYLLLVNTSSFRYVLCCCIAVIVAGAMAVDDAIAAGPEVDGAARKAALRRAMGAAIILLLVGAALNAFIPPLYMY